MKKTKLYYQAIFENTADTILIADNTMKCVDANPAATGLLGYSRKELLTLSMENFFASIILPENWQNCFGEEALPILCKNGTTVYVRCCITADFLPGLHFSQLTDITEQLTEKKALLDITERKNNEKRKLRNKITRALEEERLRLARELHDEVGMTLTAVKLDLQMLSKSATKTDNKLEAKIASSIDLVNNSLESIRSKSAFLRPPALDDLGLVAAIRNLLDDLSRHGSVHTTLNTTTPRVTSIEVETALYRCIQEALTNTARHAAANNITIDLTWYANKVVVVITDDGVGFDLDSVVASNAHLGLQGMQERVYLLDGSLEISSAPGKGTRITITVPLES